MTEATAPIDIVAVIANVVAALALDRPTDEQRAELRALIEEGAAAIEDGIFFDLPDVLYHSVRRLSASGIQNLCVSAATFWSESWLNPDRKEKDTNARILGRAYHAARLEPETFHARYVRKPSKDELPEGSLTTETAIKAALKDLGQPQTNKDDGGVLGTARRLAAVIDSIINSPGGEDEAMIQTANCLAKKSIWHIVEAEWEAERKGRVGIPGELWDALIIDMERIQANEDIAPLLTGGFAEVSIFWTDQHGIKMKARVDYLTAQHWLDLKSFSNKNGRDVESCIAAAVQYNRYHVQFKIYLDALEAVRGGLPIISNRTEEQQALIDAIQARPDELECHYVFQETGGIPNLFAYEIPFFDVPPNNKVNDAGATPEQIAAVARATRTKTGIHIRAINDIERAKIQFVLHSQVYQPGTPWSPIESKKRLSDSLFNSSWLEGEY